LFNLVFESHDGRAWVRYQIEKREPESGIDTAVVDSLKALDLEQPIRDADSIGRSIPITDLGAGSKPCIVAGPYHPV